MTRLTEAEISAALTTHPHWNLKAGSLVRDWKFSDFLEAMKFVNAVATLAEQAGHHPDIDIRYNQVRLALSTHDVGGITRRDLDLVTKLDSAWP